MSRIIKLKPKAYDDLNNIYQFSLKEFGQAKATEYIKSLDETFHKLVNTATSEQITVISDLSFWLIWPHHISYFLTLKKRYYCATCAASINGF